MSVGAALGFLGLGPRKSSTHQELAASRPANGEAAREPAEQEPSMDPETKAGDSPAEKDTKAGELQPSPASVSGQPPAEQPKEDASAEATRVTAIVELCQIAGKPDAALGFIKAKANVDTVRAQLAKARADAVDRNPVDATSPGAGAAADHGWGKIVEKVNAEAGIKPRR